MPVAFPGAEGFGAVSVGGRGDGISTGQVIHVTNLNENGPGSYFEAVKAVGPRVVVFDVSGVIDITDKPLTYTQPYLYVAGQTSPGGICFKGEEHRIQSHDITIRHCRFRTGDEDEPRDGWEDRDAVNSGDPDDEINPDPWSSYNIIFDHCSFSWAVDECLTFWYQTHDVTVQRCIVAEGLFASHHPKGPHSMGTLFGLASHAISYHHGIIANCNQRNPQFAGDLDPTNRGSKSIIDFRCNTVFNWGQEPAAIEHDGNRINFVNNFYKIGPNFHRTLDLRQCFRVASDATDAEIFIEGNIDPTSSNPNSDNWRMLRADNGSVVPQTGHRATVPFTCPAVTTETARAAHASVLADCGANVPVQDSVDERTIEQCSGNCRDKDADYFINSPSDVGGWPEFEDLPQQTDTNGDGIPDSYAILHGFGVSDTIAPVDSGDGYTWIERYVNFLAGDPGAT